MPNVESRMERIAKGIAEGAQRQVKILSAAVAPAGSRIPFTEQLSQPEALAFWRQHRYSTTGKQVLQTMSPNDVMELDLALAQAGTNEQPPNSGSGQIP